MITIILVIVALLVVGFFVLVGAVMSADIARSKAEMPHQTDARLEAAFAEYRAGSIALEDYKTLLDREFEKARDRISDIRMQRSSLGKDLFELDMENAQEVLEAVGWRRDWAHDELAKDNRARPGFAQQGKWARFRYVDVSGAASAREIVNWQRRGATITGYDRSKSTERTFHQDRISDWQAG